MAFGISHHRSSLPELSAESTRFSFMFRDLFILRPVALLTVAAPVLRPLTRGRASHKAAIRSLLNSAPRGHSRLRHSRAARDHPLSCSSRRGGAGIGNHSAGFESL